MTEEPSRRPSFPPPDALSFAADLFDVSVRQVAELPSERDQNFLLQEEGTGRKYVLKISQEGEDPEVLDFQCRMLEHLGRAGFSLSKVLHAATGEEMVEVQGPQGRTHLVRLLTWIPGTILPDVRPQTPELFRSLGSFMGGLDRALEDFSHPAQGRELKWNLTAAGRVVRSHLRYVDDPERREFLEEMAGRFVEMLGPLVPDLRVSVIHGDANDHNVIVSLPEAGAPPQERRVIGVVDFGDAVRSFTVAEAAIAGAYAMLGKRDPFTVASHVVEGYHKAYPLGEAEVAALFPLMGLRLCASVAISAHQRSREPGNEYLAVSEAPAWALLEEIARESPHLPHYLFRHACGLEPVPGASAVISWLMANGKAAAPVIGRMAEGAGGPVDGRVVDGRAGAAIGRGADPGANGMDDPFLPEPLHPLIQADPVDLATAPIHVFDLGVDSGEFGITPEPGDARGWTDLLFRKMKAVGAEVGVGRYDEVRPWYTSDVFASPTDDGPEWRTVHLGIDLFVDPGSPVYAPFHAVVHSVGNNLGNLDYGPTVILEHRVEAGMFDHAGGLGWEDTSSRGGAHGGASGGTLCFWTLYGHLGEEVLTTLTPGQPIRKRDPFARVGAFPTNGNWAPHLHFQVITDTLGKTGDFPGVARPSQLPVWKALSPDPNLVLRMPDPLEEEPVGGTDAVFPGRPGPSEPGRPSGVGLSRQEGKTKEEILAERARYLGPNLSISYRDPLEIVRGRGQFLYDEAGQPYLDCVNNVPNVGHCHPRVVEAGRRQMAVLNTNTRYLHDLLTAYAERLLSLFPEPLSTVYFVNSGSEANELALRMARAHTKRTDVLVVEGAYHGNTSAMVDLSPYKFDGPGGEGPRAWVHKVPMPDPYRGRYRALPEADPGEMVPDEVEEATTPGDAGSGEPEYLPADQVGPRYVHEVRKVLNLLRAEGRAPAAFFCESMLGCGGQIVLPAGYLAGAFDLVRGAGGVCVADEVQVGFGRAGTRFWAFETQEVVPDIVTLGKPMGNGHPLGAVVTTAEIARSFTTGMEYFNTYGGNPVSCAVGLAVLDVLRDEGLQENARLVGEHLLEGLRGLQERHPILGDVRGLGLYLGVEIVKDPDTREPDRVRASRLKERLREHRILLSTDGPQDNVLKIKPPLVFTSRDADRLVATLGRILEEEEFQG